MTYPITDRTYFSDENTAWAFAQQIVKLNHWIVSDYGYEADKAEPYYIETMNDPFSTKDQLLKRAGII